MNDTCAARHCKNVYACNRKTNACRCHDADVNDGMMHMFYISFNDNVMSNICDTSLLSSGSDDIAFNYLIGSDGVVYEGRGSHKQSAATYHWNNRSISLAFLGLFNSRPPSDNALYAAEGFLQYLVDHGKIYERF